MKTITLRQTDLSSTEDAEAFVTLLRAYMVDPKGDMSGLSMVPDSRVVEKLRRIAHRRVFFAEMDGIAAGMAVCFLNFSTFRAESLLNLHDLIVLSSYRKRGIARALLQAIESYAKSVNCCKITLEVRDDNAAAMDLYRSCGFQDEPCPMHFWTKRLKEIGEIE